MVYDRNGYAESLVLVLVLLVLPLLGVDVSIVVVVIHYSLCYLLLL